MSFYFISALLIPISVLASEPKCPDGDLIAKLGKPDQTRAYMCGQTAKKGKLPNLIEGYYIYEVNEKNEVRVVEEPMPDQLPIRIVSESSISIEFDEIDKVFDARRPLFRTLVSCETRCAVKSKCSFPKPAKSEKADPLEKYFKDGNLVDKINNSNSQNFNKMLFSEYAAALNGNRKALAFFASSMAPKGFDGSLSEDFGTYSGRIGRMEKLGCL